MGIIYFACIFSVKAKILRESIHRRASDNSKHLHHRLLARRAPAEMHSSRLPSRRIVLGIQMTFNLGFYAVVPFLATHMRDHLLMSATAIGLTLGMRSFSQQGMFFLGGLLAQRFGYRRVMITGCAVRVLGYLGLAVAGTPAQMVISACLTGLGGAAFSPCLEALAAQLEREDHAVERRRRHGIFAHFAVAGELGAVAGPLLGGLLMRGGFPLAAILCAGMFAVATAVLYAGLPADDRRPSAGVLDGWRDVLRDRAFLAFALAYGSYLFNYNQLYLALPAELARIAAGEAWLAWLFVLASALVILLQLPIAALCARWQPRFALMIGFAMMSSAFLCLAAGPCLGDAHGFADLAVLPAVLFTILLSLGQMCAVPVAMSLLPRFAGERPLPLYYGVLASVGGAMTLFGNILLGWAHDWVARLPAAGESGAAFSAQWCLAALLPACSVWAFSRLALPARH
ncbi:MFS transporter [Herbaspirillum sp. LeCh32-8]|uniref:MFS transporter n=1 Tax=Herbaspirillum sp. LeCh32-8 TaxID=2821356 RepID=UPI001AE6469E|nr:MFS transporter [Herbaspirillum sp. LeCh32-8]MBP0598079.1 MFS transporter [Herbaspirillum sp. LeCh32-8]